MEQLSSIDNSFLQAETPNLPMHVCSISVYDPSTAPSGTVRFTDILRLYENAIIEVPLFRRRLVNVPGKLDFPYWIEDPDFDIEFHVRHIALPKPGDWRQFYIQLARLHAHRMDLSRPLWEVYVIEGLNNLDGIAPGSFAIVQKLHHAAIDGAALRRMFLAMHHPQPDAPLPTAPDTLSLAREPRPGALRLLLKSYQHALLRPAKFSRTTFRLAQGMRAISNARKLGDIEPAENHTVTRFNGAISPNRVVTSASMDLDEFVQLRHAVPGSTINDLAICVISGALRNYLADKGESIDQPLIVQVPVNIRTQAQSAEDGNKISAINVSTCSDIADPCLRLQAIRRSTESGKKRLEYMGDSVMEDMADALGPLVTQGIFSAMEHSQSIQSLTGLHPGGPNLAFSNMVGTQAPMYLCGAELVWGLGLGPLMPDMGLFITASSGMGRFIFGVNACRDMMPDPEFFEQCLHQAYAEARQSLQPPTEASAAKKPMAQRASNEVM